MSTINVCNCNGVDYTLSSDAGLLFEGIKNRYVGITGTNAYYSLSFRERVFAVYLNEFDKECECVRRCLCHGGDVDGLVDFICYLVCSDKLGKGGNAYLIRLCPRLGYHFHYMVDESSLAIFFKYDGIDIAGVKEFVKSRCLLLAGQGDYRFLSGGYNVNKTTVSFWKDLGEDLKWQWLRRGCKDFESWCDSNVRRDCKCVGLEYTMTYTLQDGREFAYSEVV